jgi:hypothetical protein
MMGFREFVEFSLTGILRSIARTLTGPFSPHKLIQEAEELLRDNGGGDLEQKLLKQWIDILKELEVSGDVRGYRGKAHDLMVSYRDAPKGTSFRPAGGVQI